MCLTMFKRIFILFVSVLVAFSCSEESNPAFDSENFTSIFDNYKFSIAYTPIDMVQTSDGGYLILGSRKLPNSNFSGIYLLKADKNGNFVKEVEVDENYVNPVARFTQIGARYYFFCMEGSSVQAYIASIDENLLENVTFNPVLSANGINARYPSISLLDGTLVLLQCYDDLNKLV